MNKWLGLKVGNFSELFLVIDKTNNLVGVNDSYWCSVTMDIRNNHVSLMVYGDILTSFEVNEIKKNMKLILDKKNLESFELKTIEDRLNFIFHEDSIDLKIRMDNSNDYYNLYLNSNDIKNIYDYLIKIDI